MASKSGLNISENDQKRAAWGLEHGHRQALERASAQERKAWLGVGGGARKSLQVDIVRKYLQLTDGAREHVGPAGFIEALYRDSVEVVDNGYLQLLQGIASLGKIAMIVAYTAYHAPPALLPQLALPAFMILRILR